MSVISVHIGHLCRAKLGQSHSKGSMHQSRSSSPQILPSQQMKLTVRWSMPVNVKAVNWQAHLSVVSLLHESSMYLSDP